VKRQPPSMAIRRNRPLPTDVGVRWRPQNDVRSEDLSEQDPGGGPRTCCRRPRAPPPAGRKAQLAEHDAIQQTGKPHGQKTKGSLKTVPSLKCWGREPGAGSTAGIHRGGGERRRTYQGQSRWNECNRIGIRLASRFARAEVRSGSGGGVSLGLDRRQDAWLAEGELVEAGAAAAIPASRLFVVR